MSEESGFTLVELLLVLIILGILLAIAAPTYLSLKDRANKTAATANLNAVVPDIESYSADNYSGSPNDPDPLVSTTDSGYAGMSFTILQSTYDKSIVPSSYFGPFPTGFTASPDTSSDYCIYTLSGVWWAAKHGPNGTVTTGKRMTFGANTCYAS